MMTKDYIKGLLAGTSAVAEALKFAIEENEDEKKPLLSSPAKLDFEHLIATDKQFIFLKYGNDFVWYEAAAKLTDFLDEDPSGEIESLDDVFQIFKDGQPLVVIIHHDKQGQKVQEINSFWLEDSDIRNDAILFNYDRAFKKLMAANYPKPHSRNCILRKPVGPKDTNPQYVFGTIDDPIFVDAETGDVSDTNPAF
jgi:hypothetical protein